MRPGLFLLVVFISAFSITWPSVAQDELPVPTEEDHKAFQEFLVKTRKQAIKSGISTETIDAAFTGITINPKVLRANAFQPEFSRPVWAYMDAAVSQTRVANGKKMLAENNELLDRIEKEIGVPKRFLVAIWGLETSYGANTGGYNVIEALATLGFKGRRADFGRNQLLAALEIIDQGNKGAGEMTGSWAGAMGQTQFIPTTYLAYARDFDGDGRKDIWDSRADALASTANLLRANDWKKGQSWGREVKLSDSFDYSQAGLSTFRPLSHWNENGVTYLNGDPLPDIARSAAVLVPAGHKGPAFLVFPNFKTIMRYNNSSAYALAISHLADRLADGPEISASWPRELKLLTRSQRKEMQSLLNQKGYSVGGVDGIIGARTKKAIRKYQSDKGLVPDGFPTTALLDSLKSG